MSNFEIIFLFITSSFFVYVLLKSVHDWGYTSGWCDAFKKANIHLDEANEAFKLALKSREAELSKERE